MPEVNTGKWHGTKMLQGGENSRRDIVPSRVGGNAGHCRGKFTQRGRLQFTAPRSFSLKRRAVQIQLHSNAAPRLRYKVEEITHSLPLLSTRLPIEHILTQEKDRDMAIALVLHAWWCREKHMETFLGRKLSVKNGGNAVQNGIF